MDYIYGNSCLQMGFMKRTDLPSHPKHIGLDHWIAKNTLELSWVMPLLRFSMQRMPEAQNFAEKLHTPTKWGPSSDKLLYIINPLYIYNYSYTGSTAPITMVIGVINQLKYRGHGGPTLLLVIPCQESRRRGPRSLPPPSLPGTWGARPVLLGEAVWMYGVKSYKNHLKS